MTEEETKIIKEFEKKIESEFLFLEDGNRYNKAAITVVKEEGKKFILKALKSQRQKTIEKIKELHNKSESRSAELECSQGGYEYGLEDSIKIIEE